MWLLALSRKQFWIFYIKTRLRLYKMSPQSIKPAVTGNLKHQGLKIKKVTLHRLQNEKKAIKITRYLTEKKWKLYFFLTAVYYHVKKPWVFPILFQIRFRTIHGVWNLGFGVPTRLSEAVLMALRKKRKGKLRNKLCFPCLHSLVKTEANVWENSRADQWKTETQSTQS